MTVTRKMTNNRPVVCINPTGGISLEKRPSGYKHPRYGAVPDPLQKPFTPRYNNSNRNTPSSSYTSYNSKNKEH